MDLSASSPQAGHRGLLSPWSQVTQLSGIVVRRRMLGGAFRGIVVGRNRLNLMSQTVFSVAFFAAHDVADGHSLRLMGGRNHRPLLKQKNGGATPSQPR